MAIANNRGKNMDNNIKLFILFVILIVFELNVFSDELKIYSPNKLHFFYTEELSKKQYRLYVYNGICKENILIYEGYLKYPLNNSVVIWHNNDLLEINIGTGSPGNYSLFYSCKLDKTSDKHYFPVAVNADRYLVLIGQEEVYITNIFENITKYYIKRDFENTAIKWLIFEKNNTYFDFEGNLIIKYMNSVKVWITEKINSTEIDLY